MADVTLEVKDWSEGVVRAIEGDGIPNNALTSGWNTAFRSIGGQGAMIGTRPGLVAINGNVAIANTPEVLRMIPYDYDTGTTVHHYGVLVLDDGTIAYKTSTDTVTSNLPVPANFPYTSTAFTAGEIVVDGAVMNNQVFLVADNGQRRSLKNTTYEPFGLSPIASVAITNQAGGSASMPAETYDVAVTSYDSSIGEESSASVPVSVTLGANERIRVIISPTATDTAQYTHWRVYIRRQTTQSQLWRVLLLEDVAGVGITSIGDIPIATTTAYVDLTAGQIAALILPAPSTTENNEPSTTVRFVETFGHRLILADRSNFYWSKLDIPRAFPTENFERIETGEGDEITGLHKFSDEVLMIFTRTATWGLFGNDPQSWTLRPIDLTTGCVGCMSLVSYGERVGWWSSQHGPVEWDGGEIRQIGDDLLGHEICVENINPSRVGRICAGRMPEGDRVVWSLTVADEDRNTLQLPFNYRLNRWESENWDGADAAALATLTDNDGRQRLFVGGYGGRVFKYDPTVANDGVPSGTIEMEWIAPSDSTNIIEGVDFMSASGALQERKVNIFDSAGRPHQKVRIFGSTSTTLLVIPEITGLTTGGTYTVHIGGPDVRIYTKWFDFDQPFLRKRVDQIYFHAKSLTEDTSLRVATQINFIDNTQPSILLLDLEGSVWDEGVWDESVWSGAGSLKKRLRIIKNCTAFRSVILHPDTNEDFILLKMGALARVLTDRYYG